jgi:prepilin-type N-terminal cleavage/methylation domain-containing protein
MNTHRRQLGGRRGFTLVEAIATIVILGSVMAVCARVISTATAAYTSSATRAEMHAELSSAMERIMLELRSCRIGTGGTFGPDISAVNAAGVTWTTPSGTRQLSVSAGSLILTMNGAGAPLAMDITSFSVQAFDQSNTALSATLNGSECVPIRRIEITISATRQGVTETLRSRTFLRCTAMGFSAS